jgi:hypothetical protein
MKKILFLLTLVLFLGLSSIASASFIGTEIPTLSGIYGSSWDGYELWSVLSDNGYKALADDINADINGGSKSAYYHVYKDTFWQAPAYSSMLVAEVAGYANNNRFGWYEKGHAKDVIKGTSPSTWGEIFSGPDSPYETANFSNPDELGFWINPNGVAGKYFFTNSYANGGNLQALTFYLGDYPGFGNEYLICLEDLKFSGCTDRDFQDMIVRLRPVPEPASISLLGLGLLGILKFRKKYFL